MKILYSWLKDFIDINLTPAELEKPSTRYFMQRNPGYRQGDELVCLCEVAASNLKPLAQRVFLRGMKPVPA